MTKETILEKLRLFSLGGEGALAPSFPPERKSLFTVDALCTLVIDHQAFPLQHDVQPGTAKALPLPCQLTHSAPQDIIITLLWPVQVDRG